MAEVVSAARAELGTRIRMRRTELKISQEELGRRSGIHWSYIGAAERGQRNPTLTTLLTLAEALDIDPGDLVRGLTRSMDTPPEVADV